MSRRHLVLPPARTGERLKLRRNMWVWGAVLLIGVAIVGFYDPTDMEPGEEVAGGFGAALLIPLGYFLALAGAAGLFIAWVRGRKR